MRAREPPLFFEGLREAAARLPAGLVRLAPPASPEAIAAAEARLARPLPHAYRELLRSFDGVDLFHETVVVCGVGPEAFRELARANERPSAALRRPGELVFAEGPTGDLYVLGPDEAGAERVWRLPADAEERWLAGSSLARWLDAIVAREQLLYDQEGEFLLEAFEPDGEELTPAFALRQAERALRKDRGGAEHHHALGLAQRRLGRLDRARAAFAESAALDPVNPWPWFDLGRADLGLGHPREAAEAFRRAADAAAPADSGRLLAWAARAAHEAGDRPAAEAARAEALRRQPTLREALQRAAEAAAAEGDEPAHAEAAALAAVFDPALPLRHRLPVMTEEAPPAPRHRPRPKR